MSIFEQDKFTLKDFCTTFENISDEINIISLCYKKFSSSDNNYIKHVKYTRNNYGLLNINGEHISFREILQMFDINFLKLVIRIKIEPKHYDIKISWPEFENKIKNISKNDLEFLIKN